MHHEQKFMEEMVKFALQTKSVRIMVRRQGSSSHGGQSKNLRTHKLKHKQGGEITGNGVRLEPLKAILKPILNFLQQVHAT